MKRSMQHNPINNPIAVSQVRFFAGPASWGAVLAIVVALGVAGGCVKPKFIPHTKVLDVPLNREILKVVEKYRRAMEQLDGATVLSLAHPNYLDRAGTPEGNDDADYEGLKHFLAKKFKQTKKVRYSIEYQRLTITGKEAKVDTYIDATFFFEPRKANPRWRRFTDHNRFTLLKDDGRWQFISGL